MIDPIIVPGGPYDVVYEDPPWPYNVNNAKKGDPFSKVASNRHYSVMGLNELLSMKINVANNAVQFMWVLNGFLPQALELMRARGFMYSTVIFVYVKLTSKGNLRNGHGPLTLPGAELCLLGKRGKTRGILEHWTGIKQVQLAPVERHSKKPDLFRKLIEELTPNAHKRIELFARQKTPKWRTWGNEV